MTDIKQLDFLLPNDLTGVTSSSGNSSQAVEGASFSDILKNAISGVNDAQQAANTAVEQALSGESTDVYDTMIALQKADTSLKMMLEVRNKLLEAYQEVIKTQM